MIPALRTLRGDVPVIMISGGSMGPRRAGDARDRDYLRIAAEMGAAQTLAKPFNTRELHHAGRRGSGRSQPLAPALKGFPGILLWPKCHSKRQSGTRIDAINRAARRTRQSPLAR